MSRNPIFNALIGDDDSNLEALIAYSLYKKHKREWAKQIEQETGNLPSAEENTAFFKAVGTQDQLDRYRKDAQDILIAYANNMIDSATPDIEKVAISGRVETAAQKIEASTSFLQLIKGGVVSTLISTATLILIAIGIRLWGIDLLSAYNSLAAPIKP